MKKFICFLLMALLMVSLCACETQKDTNNDATSETLSAEEVVSGVESAEETGKPDDVSAIPSDDATSAESESSAPEEETDPETDGVSYDEAGNVILSDPPTYEEVLALHRQDPDTYRDPGELQPETHEMIQLEDGQWYQSYVAGSYNCRFILLSWEELGQGTGFGDFRPIGSAENAFLYNLGVMYDDPKGDTLYGEGSRIAVRGTLSQAPDGYAYQLQLPDELIVCAGLPDGTAALLETETLAIPEAYVSLFEGKTGEVTVTGVVMKDKNDVFYLKDVELYP